MSETKGEQEHDVKRIMNNDPMSLVLQFFAGCTQLKGKYEKALKLLLRLANKPVEALTPIARLAENPHKKADPCRVLLAVLHCIYESPQEELFLQAKPTNLEGNSCCFVFDHYRLSPFNCVMIGRFVSCLLAQLTGTLPLTLCTRCYKLGDYEFEQFLEPVFSTVC